MKHICRYIFLFTLSLLAVGCHEWNENPNFPGAYTDFTINLNQSYYYSLNFSGNYVYLKPEINSASRGYIVYRMPSYDYEFRVYDRFPPNYPDACCSGDTCTRLITDGIFVIDNCNGIRYNILDGSVFDGDGEYELIQYRWSYNASDNTLHVFN